MPPLNSQVPSIILNQDGTISIQVNVYGFDAGTPVEISGQATQDSGAVASFYSVQPVPAHDDDESAAMWVTSVPVVAPTQFDPYFPITITVQVALTWTAQLDATSDLASLPSLAGGQAPKGTWKSNSFGPAVQPGSPESSPEPPETGPQELRDDVPHTGGRRPEPGPPSPAVEAPPTRHLAVDLPERAPVGRRFSLLVRITLAAPDQGLSAEVKPFDVPPEGRDVFITVSAPGLAPQDDLEQDLHVPPAADSEPVRFGFVAGRVGLHTVTVRAFAGGTFLGELAVQISVEVGAALQEGRTRMAGIGALASEPGEVTLQVGIADDGRYSFQLIGEALYPVELSRRLAGDPTRAVNSIVTELRSFAAGTSPYTNPAMIRNRLQNLGVQLWADAVPEEIRRQFWAQADKIKSFTVASDLDTVPWELLYPADGDNDKGFLVEQFPVVRRVYGQGRVRKLPLASAAYVVPPGSPGNAIDEVQAVRRWLGAQVADQGVVDQLEQLAALLTSAPSVLHFACHNQFDATTGSAINMAGGPLHPNDLATMVQKRGLAAASPLVFFNACRTAGEIPGFVQMWGWAKQFMGAGAGGFIGSLWAVRSSSARVFADAFYRAFVTERVPLGAASLQARRAIADDDGDPTWLAYTVYGNPAATIGEETGT